jgi:hypothetical protein
MYSRVQHNITEEHFAHPDHARAAMANPHDALGAADGSLRYDSPLPYFVLTEATMLFRMDSRTLWSKYAWGLLNYGIALMNNLSDASQVQARMTQYASDLGDFIAPYYGLTASGELTRLLTDIAAIGISMIQAVKAGQPVDVLMASTQAPIEALSRYLNSINPNNWPQPLLNDMLTNLITFWSYEIQGRARGDALAVSSAISNISKLVITGITNSSPTHKASSLADVFSRGVIAQFPTIFSS